MSSRRSQSKTILAALSRGRNLHNNVGEVAPIKRFDAFKVSHRPYARETATTKHILERLRAHLVTPLRSENDGRHIVV